MAAKRSMNGAIASAGGAVTEVGAFYWTALAPDIVNSEREEQGLI
jgi:hypothetical protein